MAGSYPNVPSWRMPYDRDGSVIVYITNGGVVTQLSSADVLALNNESADAVTLAQATSSLSYLAVIFPERRDIDGFCLLSLVQSQLQPSIQMETSTDTTNGLDGTWTALGAAFTPATDPVAPAYRSSIVSGTALGVRGVRAKWTPGSTSRFMPKLLHLYGEISAGQSLDRLLLWHPTLDQRVTASYFDWGNAPRNSSGDLTFRVRNMSTTKTAANVRVAMEALTDTTPSTPGEHSISADGSVFGAQQTIASISPGATSDVLTLRRITPSNAQLGLSAFRLYAEAGSWTA